MPDKYVLDGGQPLPEPDLIKWGKWMQSANLHVAEDHFKIGGESVHVSTVFLGLDHRWWGEGEGLPVLWETMIFGGLSDGWQERYTSQEAAIQGHAEAVKRARGEV